MPPSGEKWTSAGKAVLGTIAAKHARKVTAASNPRRFTPTFPDTLSNFRLANGDSRFQIQCLAEAKSRHGEVIGPNTAEHRLVALIPETLSPADLCHDTS